MDNAQNTFLVTYANKKTLTETVDAAEFPNAEAYCQKRYGLDLKATEEHGTVVEQVDSTKPAAEPKEPTSAEGAAEAGQKAKK